MTTVATHPQPTETTARSRQAEPCWPGTIVIPLAEFGQSLDDPDFDQWFEAFVERNSDAYEYEISGTGHLLIREPVNYYSAALNCAWAARCYIGPTSMVGLLLALPVCSSCRTVRASGRMLPGSEKKECANWSRRKIILFAHSSGFCG